MQLTHFCDYTKDFVQRNYNLQRQGLLLVIKKSQIHNVLLMKYSHSIAKKVIAELDIQEDFITYRAFIEKFNFKFLLKSKQQFMKFAFDLFDHDSNGTICIKDLQTFSAHYGGCCEALMADFRAVIDQLKLKRTKVIAEELMGHAKRQKQQ